MHEWPDCLHEGTLTRSQHADLLAHLFPPDGCKAVAIALCGMRRGNDRRRLLVREIAPIPYEACPERQPDRVTWPTHVLPPLLAKARRGGLAVLKIHGHGRESPFSAIDDRSDRALFPSVHAWTDGDPHGSVIAYLEPWSSNFPNCRTPFVSLGASRLSGGLNSGFPGDQNSTLSACSS